MTPGGLGDLELGPDAVRARDQNRVVEAGCLEVEQPAKTAQLAVCAGPGRGAGERFDRLDQGIARIDVDPGSFVGLAVNKTLARAKLLFRREECTST